MDDISTAASRMAVLFTVRGTVQGVGFRWFTRNAALRHGVGGWVANRPDGTVAGAAHGPVSSVEAFLADLRTGPAASRVTEVVVTADTQIHPHQQGFEIQSI